MAYRSGAKGSNRDLGLHGDSRHEPPRSGFTEGYRANFDEIHFPWRDSQMYSDADTGFARTGNRLTKRYK